MFTGIIEQLGRVEQVETSGSNRSFWISSPLSSGFKPDQSVAHDGVCLTVEAVEGSRHRVTAIAETLAKTTLGRWESGRQVNLETSLRMGGSLDGHFVQGHVDTTGTCVSAENRNGSVEFEIRFPEQFAPLVIEKGSICLNGISLTAWNVTRDTFKIAIIPYTLEHTNLGFLDPGQPVNLEFDMIGKYILRKMNL